MIEVVSRYGEVTASGHAGYAPKGQDIVCSAVSILLYTLIAALGDDVIDLRMEEGDRMVKWKATKVTNIKAGVVNEGFRLLAQGYPAYISYRFVK